MKRDGLKEQLPLRPKTKKRGKNKPLSERIYLLSRAVESLREAVFITDCRRRIIYANPATGRVFGYSPEEVLGKKSAELFEGVPGNPPGLADRIKKEARSGLWVGEIFNRRKDGDIFPVWLMVNAIYGPRGKVLGYLGLSRAGSEEKQPGERPGPEEPGRRAGKLKVKAPLPALSPIRKEKQLALLARAVESLREAVVITDRDHTIIYANPAVEIVHGYSPEELSGRRAACFFEGIPGNLPDLAGRVKEEAQNNFWIGEVLNRRKNGSLFPVRLVVNTIFTERGDILGYIGISRDIAPDKRLERELEKEKDRLKNLIQAIPDAVFLKDAAGRYLLVNNAFLKITGLKKSQVVGRKDSELFSPALAKRYRQSDLAALRGTGPVHEEGKERFVSPGGEEKYFDTVKTLIHDYEGRKIGLLGVSRDITHAKRAKIALAESEEKYRLLSENSLTGVFIFSVEGKILYVNKTLLQLSGYREEELRGKTFFNFIYREDRERVKNIFMNRIGNLPAPEHYDCRAVRKDGSVAWIEIKATRITFQGQTAVLGNFIDITERKQYEEELLRHALVYRSMQEAVIISTPDGITIDVNPAAEKAFGWRREELVGRTTELLNPPEKAKKISTDIFRGLRRRGLWRGELPVIVKSGEHRTFAAFVTALRDRSGRWIGNIGINRDITEWKEKDMALKESEERYRTTINSLGDPIHVIDRDFRLVLFNTAFNDWNKRLGLETDVLGKSLFEVFPFLPKKVRAQYEQVFKSGRILVTEENTKLGGREIFTETRKIPIRDEGKVSRVITVIRDITARKQADARLREASKLEGVGTLSLGLSHEFNNILMGISGYAQLALTDLNNRRMLTKALQVINRQTLRGEELIRRLSFFGRRAKPSLEPVDLGRVLNEVVTLQGMELTKAGIRIKKQYKPHSPALADYSQMVQVFFNLIMNARQALRAGKKGVINLGVRDKGRMVEVRVADNGVGIPPDELPKIFLPFFTTKGRSEGEQIPSLGLGLWVSRQIVEELGGTVKVRSRLGAGTEFTVRLPGAGAGGGKPGGKTAKRRLPAPLPKEKKRLLIVDDEADLREVYGDYFRGRGFGVAGAPSGAEALRLCGSRRFDSILLDYVMPGLSGKHLVKKIKRLSPASRILIITGHSIPAEEKKKLKPYISKWLDKPVNLQKVSAMLNR